MPGQKGRFLRRRLQQFHAAIEFETDAAEDGFGVRHVADQTRKHVPVHREDVARTVRELWRKKITMIVYG